MIAPLADTLQSRGGSDQLHTAELLEVIGEHITNHPRSQQVQIGPSEVGTPCDRRLGYKLLRVAEREQPPAWLPTIGTAVHAWNEEAFDADNLRRAPSMDGQERWLIETRLTVGFVPGLGFIEGSCDLYDRVTATVCDWKVVGPTTIRKAKASGPGEQYRTQAHLYGNGWINAGHPVDRVKIVYLPRNGQLTDAYAWSEPFDPAIAEAGLQRLARIYAATQAVGPRVLAALPTADAHCGHCGWFRPGSTDLTKGCPGHSGVAPTNQLAGLLPALADRGTR